MADSRGRVFWLQGTSGRGTLGRSLFELGSLSCDTLLKRGDGVRENVSARRERPGKHRIFGMETIEYPGMFLFGGDVIVEDLDDAIEVGNQ